MGDPKKLASSSSVAPSPLYKQNSWSPDSDREEAWLRRKGLHKSRRRAGAHHRLSRSVTDEDLEELRGCIELGFGFDSPSSSSSSAVTNDDDEAARLSDTFPALDLYYAVHRQYSESVAAEPSTGLARSESSAAASPVGSAVSIYSPGDSPQQVKMRLKQWAQVVACSVRQHC